MATKHVGKAQQERETRDNDSNSMLKYVLYVVLWAFASGIVMIVLRFIT